MNPTKLCHLALAAICRADSWDEVLSASPPPPAPILEPLNHRVEFRVEVPRWVLADRDRRAQLAAQRDLTGSMMGDPIRPARPHSVGAAVADEPILVTCNSLCERYLRGGVSPPPELRGTLH
jgi:hypothetical protein